MSILLKNIKKIYGINGYETKALDNVNIEIKKGDFVSVMGPSGCGKSTLLNIIGCIDTPTSGEYYLNNEKINFKKLNSLSQLRNTEISFIFQNFALVKEFTVFENVMLPLKFRKMSYKDKIALVEKYIKKVGMYEIKNNLVSTLSGGQQQRVSIARALCQESNVILADEPTGALDKKNGQEIMNILVNLNNEGKTIIMVTHDENIASYSKKTILLEDGKIIYRVNKNFIML